MRSHAIMNKIISTFDKPYKVQTVIFKLKYINPRMQLPLIRKV